MAVSKYAEHFPKDLKITICLPMEANETFRDWAIVQELEADVLTLLLSRDQFPSAVILKYGDTFDVRFGKEGAEQRCSVIFADKVGLGTIKVRLTGEVSTGELREFYRIDAFIPFRHEVPKEQNLNALIGKLRKRKRDRLATEAARRAAFEEEQRLLVLRTAAGEFDAGDDEQPKKKDQKVAVFNPVDESWDNVSAAALNLSGGGIKYVTSELFKAEDLVLMEIFIPSNPPRIADCIAKVVFKNINYSIKSDKLHYNVALNFVIIDDRDRDAIVTHIAHLELMRIRMKGSLPSINLDSGPRKRMSLLMKVVWALLALAVVLFIAWYSKNEVNNEIMDSFGNAVKQYREKTGTENLWK